VNKGKIRTPFGVSLTWEWVVSNTARLLGKVVIDPANRQFYVYNRLDKLIYESSEQSEKQNCTEAWKQGLRNYTKRKLKSGKVITLNRKSYQG